MTDVPAIDVQEVLADGTDAEALWTIWTTYWARHRIQTTMVNRGQNTGNDLLSKVGQKRLKELPAITHLQALEANRLLRGHLERDCWWPIHWASDGNLDNVMYANPVELAAAAGRAMYKRHTTGDPRPPNRKDRPETD